MKSALFLRRTILTNTSWASIEFNSFARIQKMQKWRSSEISYVVEEFFLHFFGMATTNSGSRIIANNKGNKWFASSKAVIVYSVILILPFYAFCGEFACICVDNKKQTFHAKFWLKWVIKTFPLQQLNKHGTKTWISKGHC